MKSKKPLYLLTFVFFFLFSLFLVFFNTGDRFIYKTAGNTANIKFEEARIIQVLDESLENDTIIQGLVRGTQKLQIKILSGEHKGEVHTIKNYLSDRFQVRGKKGMKIIVSVDTASPGIYRISVNSYKRDLLIFFIILLFFGTLLLIGGLKGLKSILGLIFTFVCIIFLFIPMIMKGYSPVLSSIIVVILTTIVTVVSICGCNIKSISAIAGASAGVIIAGLLTLVFGELAHLSGISTEEAETLIVLAYKTKLKVRELLFSGILIASLGAVLDVAVSIAASQYEVFTLQKQITSKALFKSGMNVGKEMMGSMANTLILAFTGTSLNTLIILYVYNVQYNQLINLNAIGIEIIQGMSGSMAIILTVPIVSFFSSRLFPNIGKVKPPI